MPLVYPCQWLQPDRTLYFFHPSTILLGSIPKHLFHTSTDVIWHNLAIFGVYWAFSWVTLYLSLRDVVVPESVLGLEAVRSHRNGSWRWSEVSYQKIASGKAIKDSSGKERLHSPKNQKEFGNSVSPALWDSAHMPPFQFQGPIISQ